MMMRGLAFDDVVCVPSFSELSSRSDVDLRTNLGSLLLSIPILSAPMDTVTGGDMAAFMARNGGLGVIHRYTSIDSQVDAIRRVKEEIPKAKVGAAVGINGDAWERTCALIEAGADLICLDVAHGHTRAALDRLEKLRSEFGHRAVVMSANICTYEAAIDCIEAGADVLRVGIGSGSSCTTRQVAGVGVPQVTALLEVSRAVRSTKYLHEVFVVSDGGVRSSGDVVKALVAGANAVMVGGLFASYPVSAGPTMYVNTGERSDLGKVISGWHQVEGGADASEVFEKGVKPIDFGERIVKKKVFRGMASRAALMEKGDTDPLVPEGEEFLLDIDYDFERTFSEFVGGIRAGLAYLGCKKITDAWKRTLMEVTHNGYIEGTAHMKDRL
jgi:IMP dehydrogenase